MGKTEAPPAPKIDISVDVIRTVAIVMVIFLHATADLTTVKINTLEILRWSVNDVYQSIGRVCVPLFVMLSGALLLQPEKHDTLSSFFKKRWARIGLPWIFWALIYYAWDFLVEKHTFSSTAIFQGILTGQYYHFWYLYMLLGLYLLTPILRILLARANRSSVKLWLVVWFIGVAIVPFAGVMTNYTIFANALTTVAWIGYLLFGLGGYFVLGIFVTKVQIKPRFLSALTILGIVLTAISIFIIESPIGGNREVFAFTVYFGPWTMLAALALFLFLNTIKLPPQECQSSLGVKLVRAISQNTLPIFLLHVIVLESFQRGYLSFGAVDLALNGNTINTIIGVPLITALTLFACLGIIIPLKKIPYLKKLIG
jgi:surface polysaccharide O-acyltransferase-like enzyme